MKTIAKLHAKAHDIGNPEPGYYANPQFALDFHTGPINPHGVLNGPLPEEVLAVLIDFTNGQVAPEVSEHLQAALDLMLADHDVKLAEPKSNDTEIAFTLKDGADEVAELDSDV